jgi:hypothetical protein
MDERIGCLVADNGVDRAAAAKAMGVILDFLVQEETADKVQPLLARLAGAEALMRDAASESGGFTARAMGGAVCGMPHVAAAMIVR